MDAEPETSWETPELLILVRHRSVEESLTRCQTGCFCNEVHDFPDGECYVHCLECHRA